jgi:hypothetical protein
VKTVGSAYVGSNPTPATTYNASSSGMRPDHRRWLRGLRADPSRRSCEFGRCRVWPGQSTAAGSRRNLRAWILLGAVEWWVSRSRAAAVTGKAGRWAPRWPAASLGYAAGTWTPGRSGFQHRSLNSAWARRLSGPVPGWHDALRRLAAGPQRGADPGSRVRQPGQRGRHLATSASQPKTAVLRCRALHPAIASTVGGGARRGWG